VVVSERGGSSKSNQVLLVLAGSPTRSPTSWRVVWAHLGFDSGSASTSGCIDFASNCTDYVSRSSESYESKLSSEEELAYACSSSLTGGRTKVFACGC
jgi:hypothetical protein